MTYLLFMLLGAAVSYLFNLYILTNLASDEVSRYASLFTFISIVSFATSTLYYAAIGNTSGKISSRPFTHRYRLDSLVKLRIFLFLSYTLVLILSYHYSYNLALFFFLFFLFIECTRYSLLLGRYTLLRGMSKANILSFGFVTVRFVITFVLSALLFPDHLILSVLVAQIITLGLATTIIQLSPNINQGSTFTYVFRSLRDRASLIYIFVFASYSSDLILLRFVSSGAATEQYALSAVVVRMIAIPLLTWVTIRENQQPNTRQRLTLTYSPILAMLIGLVLTTVDDSLLDSLSNQILGMQIIQSTIYFIVFSILRSVSYPQNFALFVTVFSFVLLVCYSFFYVSSAISLVVFSTITGLILVLSLQLARKLDKQLE
jgi:hypothetical protein